MWHRTFRFQHFFNARNFQCCRVVNGFHFAVDVRCVQHDSIHHIRHFEIYTKLRFSVGFCGQIVAWNALAYQFKVFWRLQFWFFWHFKFGGIVHEFAKREGSVCFPIDDFSTFRITIAFSHAPPIGGGFGQHFSGGGTCLTHGLPTGTHGGRTTR